MASRRPPSTGPRKTGKGSPCWALLAVSSERQSETLAYQRQWAKETAAAHGWHLSRVIEGVSTGKAGPRRIVRDLLAELRLLDPDARPEKLLMIRADRLGRGSVVESQIIIRDLLALGVSIFTRDQGQVKLDSAMDELISAATLAVARHENDVRSDKMRNVRRRKREAGEPMGVAPYGLRYKGKRFARDPERAPIVREAFKLRVEGSGYNAIARRLMAIAPPHVFLNGNSRAVRWSTTRVSDLLSNRAYVGTIVDDATFARAQKIAALLTNQRIGAEPRRYPWPLAGSIQCLCGRTLIGIACGNEPWRYRYYGCRARWQHEGRFRLVRADSLETQFVNLLSRLRASPRLVERYSRRVTSPVSVQALERSIRDLKSKLQDVARRRDSAWELHVSGKVRAEDVQERLDALATQRDDLQGNLANAQEQLAIAKAASARERDVAALVARAAKTFGAATVAEQNRIARAVSLELGGLYVNAGSELEVGKSPDAAPELGRNRVPH